MGAYDKRERVEREEGREKERVREHRAHRGEKDTRQIPENHSAPASRIS